MENSEEKKIPDNVKGIFESEVSEEVSTAATAEKDIAEYKDEEIAVLGEEKTTKEYVSPQIEVMAPEEMKAPQAVQGNPFKDEEQPTEYGVSAGGSTETYQQGNTDYASAVSAKSNDPSWLIRRDEL